MRAPVALLMLFLPVVAAAADSALLGRWIGQTPYAGIELVFKADGGGSFDGEPLSFSSAQGALQVMLDGELTFYTYRAEGRKLTLDGADGRLVFARAPTAPTAPSAKGPAAPATSAGGDSLSRLLLSSGWCSFSYSGGSSYGRSKSSRVAFFDDGSYSSSAQSESYSSNAYGSVAGQGHRGNAGRWAVKDGALLMSQGQGPLQPVALKVDRNSNGYPILNADGTEYMQCK